MIKLGPAVEGSTQLGYPETVVRTIGIIELVCLVLYVLPRTSVLGAILLTGYLGGAIATHVRVGSPLLTHTLFPIYVAVLIWGGLFLRDDRLRKLICRLFGYGLLAKHTMALFWLSKSRRVVRRLNEGMKLWYETD